jgi:hypothetical protein
MPSSPTELADPTARLTARAAAQRPDLAAAFEDDGWLPVVITETLLTGAGLAFDTGDVALARPAVARHPGDFVVYSERTATLAGLRHGEHFAFGDEAEA